MSSRKLVELTRNETKGIGGNAQPCSPPTDRCEKIREAAYSKWEAAGCPGGNGVDFWLQAEAELAAETPPSIATC